MTELCLLHCKGGQTNTARVSALSDPSSVHHLHCHPQTADAKTQHIEMVGHSKEVLQAALQTIQRMLSAPVWTSPTGEDPMLLEMLQVVCRCECGYPPPPLR